MRGKHILDKEDKEQYTNSIAYSTVNGDPLCGLYATVSQHGAVRTKGNCVNEGDRSFGSPELHTETHEETLRKIMVELSF